MRHVSRRYGVLFTMAATALFLVASQLDNAHAQLACGSAGAPACDGACPTGQDCEEQSGLCICKPSTNPCGVDAGAPLCYGLCPPSNPICADIAGSCQCVGGPTPTPTATATATAGGPTTTPTVTAIATPGAPTVTATPTAGGPTATPTPATSTTPSCAALPVAGCRTPSVGQKAFLMLMDKAPDDAKDLLQWKWIKGSSTAKADFGTPLTSTSYQLCIYNGAPIRILDATIPAGGVCGASNPKPCWKDKTHGFDYKDKDLTPDGIEQLKLKEGADGKAQIILKGKGLLLDDPAIPVTLPVTVQLLNNTNSVCWEAVYSTPTKNTAGPPGQFKAKAD